MFVVMAYRSSTSALGYAAAPCKSEGKVLLFATLEEAEAQASLWNDKIKSKNVRYRAEQF
jgi:hypothetical protein